MSTPTNTTPPPQIILNPLFQLEDYLQSLEDENHDPSSTTKTTTTAVNEDRQDEILHVAEFLYGEKPLASALHFLDAADTTITKISAKNNHRSLYLVSSSSSSSSWQQQQQQHKNDYLCLCDDSLYYCSCRSFLEKNAKKTKIVLCKHLLALKLLPYLLPNHIPHPRTITTVTDEEFANLVLDRTLGYHHNHPQQHSNNNNNNNGL